MDQRGTTAHVAVLDRLVEPFDELRAHDPDRVVAAGEGTIAVMKLTLQVEETALAGRFVEMHARQCADVRRDGRNTRCVHGQVAVGDDKVDGTRELAQSDGVAEQRTEADLGVAAVELQLQAVVVIEHVAAQVVDTGNLVPRLAADTAGVCTRAPAQTPIFARAAQAQLAHLAARLQRGNRTGQLGVWQAHAENGAEVVEPQVVCGGGDPSCAVRIAVDRQRQPCRLPRVVGEFECQLVKAELEPRAVVVEREA